MTNVVRRPLLPSIALAFAFSISPALAQSGSVGGSIGNDDKSVSGSRQDRSADPAPSARKTRSAPAQQEEQRSSPRRSGGGSGSGGGGGGGAGSFDGAWVVVSVGCGGTTTGAVVVSSGRIIGEGVSGSISPSGGVSTVGNFNGVTVTSSGRVSGRRGSGSFRRSDGCSGSWSSTKQ